MLNRLGVQAPGQPGRRRVPGGFPECLGGPAGPPEGSPGAPGAEEIFLRSCVCMQIRLGLQAPGQPGRRRVPGGVPECPGRPPGPPSGLSGGSGSCGGFYAELCPHAITVRFKAPLQARSPQGARWCPEMPREAPLGSLGGSGS